MLRHRAAQQRVSAVLALTVRPYPRSVDAPESRFDDRLVAATYADDEPIHVFSPETQAEAWVPERVFARMQAVAVGYDLHVIPLLAEEALRFLDGSQAVTFTDEVGFIAQVTNDPALHGHLAAMLAVANDGIYARAKCALAFDWP